MPYHSVPVLNHVKTKEELKEALQGECFEKVQFEHKMLRKYVPVLISENWVVIAGRLIPRTGVEKIYYFHESPIVNYEQIRIIYELRQKEISNLLHKISPEVIEKAETTNTSRKKDKSVIYWNMNYKGKFRRTLWFIPVVIILCFITPLFMGSFWFIYDIILVVVLIWQLRYTYKMMKIEEQKLKRENKNVNIKDDDYS